MASLCTNGPFVPSGRPTVGGASRASDRRATLAHVIEDVPVDLRERIVAALRDAGARFALLHGSRAAGTHREDSDTDVAAWWGASAPASFEVSLPSSVDLLVLDTAPLELRGRVAQHGLLLFDDDPPARVRWVATTRKIYADERPRLERAHREFLEGLRRGR